MEPKVKEEAREGSSDRPEILKDESRLRCPILGPARAGKSSFIDSLDQACADPLACEGPIQLEYLRSEASVAASIFRGPWRSRAGKRLDLLLEDGPAGALFPAELDRGRSSLLDWERKMVEESRQADALVVCIDSTDSQRDRTSRHLRNVLTALSTSRQDPASRPVAPAAWRRLIDRMLRRSTGPLPMPWPRIQTERFLLLLTQIDRFVSRPLDPASPIGEGGRSPTPLQIAAALSPVELACEIFQASNLLRILSALEPGAELAIGLVSAWGFDASGFPFLEQDAPVYSRPQEYGRRTADWHPFGVREALCFLIDGQVGGPVELVTREKIVGSRSYVLDLPPRYFD